MFLQEVHIGGLAEDAGSPTDSLLLNHPPHRETPHPHPWRPATHSDRELNSTPTSELYPSSNRASPEVPQNCTDVWGRRLRVTQVAEIISDVTEPIMEASEPLDENMSRRQQIQVSQSFSLHFHIFSFAWEDAQMGVRWKVLSRCGDQKKGKAVIKVTNLPNKVTL